MAVFNGERFLPEAIDSILTQTHSGFNFIVVDDGSTDNSPSILNAYAQRDSRVRVIPRQNGGLAAALNHGLRHITEPFVVRMDADDVALPHRFSTQLRFLAEHPNVAAVGSKVLCIDEVGRPRHRRTTVTGPDAIAKALLRRNCINHSSVMIRTAALHAVGGYREWFRVSEDYDLWLRISEGHRLDNIDEVLLKYRTYSGAAKNARGRARMTAYSVSAIADHLCRRHGLPTSDGAIDVAEPVSVVEALRSLMDEDLSPDEKAALHRHCLRLVRNVPGRTVGAFGAFLARRLLAEGEYGQLAKLALYSAARAL